MLTLALTLQGLSVADPAPPRTIPSPLPNHPGNIFLSGEPIVVPLPANSTSSWWLVDYDGHRLANIAPTNLAALGSRPIGFYRLRPADERNSNWISFAVLSPLKAPTPPDSPVGLDVAMAWFYPREKMEAVANLCALAGVNWVRDRLNWAELEPQRGAFKSAPTRYDHSASAQHDTGLQVLQVNHLSPRWAAENAKRFPTDLRDAYQFWRAVAQRWSNSVGAFEPWNEADIPMFGGHTGAEMASLQKAAYWGLRSGNPRAVACWNVFATHNRAQLEDLRDNDAAPYFDTFNLHHYEPFETYPSLYADFRAVSAGKPLWVTEAARPVKWSDERSKELSDGDLREQAERVAKTYALALHEGAAVLFYFLLPHYVEHQTQFGLLRADLTPRPGYVALAAAGRLLAGARPLGRLASTNARTHAVCFRARPDGEESEVVVAWSDRAGETISFPAPPRAVWTHLGAPVANPAGRASLELKSAPQFVVFSRGDTRGLHLIPPPKAPPFERGQASPIVLQATWPEARTALKRSAYRVSSQQPVTIPLSAYNFGTQDARGTWRVRAPEGWRVSLPGTLSIAAGGRESLQLTIDASGGARRLVETVRIEGVVGPEGRSVLSLRLMPEPFTVSASASVSLPGAATPARWQPTISGNGEIRLSASADSVVIDAAPGSNDKWVYPQLRLETAEAPPRDSRGLVLRLHLIEGDGDFRVIFEEQNGSSYLAELLTRPERGAAVETVALFEEAHFGAGWAKPDDNGRLDPERIVAVKIGCNTKADRVRYSVSALRWIRAD